MTEHSGSARRTRALIGLSRWAEALDEVQKALAVNPFDSDLLTLLATTQYGLGDFEAALDASDRAIAAQWSRATSHSIRGLLLGKLMRFDEAAEALDVALSIEPDNATNHTTYAEMLMDRTIDAPPGPDELADHLAKMFRHASKAAELAPEEVSSHRVLASAYLITNKPALAEQSARRGLALNPNDTKCLHVLGVTLEARGKTREAGDAYVAAAKSSPGSRAVARVAQLEGRPPLLEADNWFWVVALAVLTMVGLAAGRAPGIVWVAAGLLLISCVCAAIAVRMVKYRLQRDQRLSPEAREVARRHQALHQT